MIESEAKFLDLPLVVIDEGTFKYVLLSVKPENSSKKEPIYFIRGDSSCEYHLEVIGPLHQILLKKGYNPEICGGGFITHNPANKEINIYGYSVQYGEADHTITSRILSSILKNYNVTHSSFNPYGLGY